MAKKKILRVALWNRYAQIDDVPEKELEPYFSYTRPGFRYSPAFRMGYWDGRVRYLRKNGRAPSGLFRARRTLIESETAFRFKVECYAKAPEFKKDGLRSDRAYQNQCVAAMINEAAAGGGLVLNATGTGKTRIAALFFSYLVGEACFVVDELTLLAQARRELSTALGERVGIIGNQKYKPRRITVATVQTLHRHRHDPRFKKWSRRLSVLIIDEVHVAMNKRSFSTVAAFQPLAVFGLTATMELQKKDVSTRAFALAGPVCFEYPLEKGVAEGYLAAGVVQRVDFYNPCGEVDYQADYNEEIVENKDRNLLVRALVREANRRGKFTIVLVERIAHLKRLSRYFSDIPHRLVFGEKDVQDRLSAKHKFERGKIRLLIANKVFKKGIDIKRTDVIIDAAAMKSKNDAIQKFGRGIRTHSEKSGLLYFDVSDCGGRKGSSEENRFERAARSRARAFKKHGIFVRRVRWRPGMAGEIFERAEKDLTKAIRRVQ